MRANGWHTELVLTVCLKLSTNLRGNIFNRIIPFRLRIPHKIFSRTVEAQIEDLEVPEHV